MATRKGCFSVTAISEAVLSQKSFVDTIVRLSWFLLDGRFDELQAARVVRFASYDTTVLLVRRQPVDVECSCTPGSEAYNVLLWQTYWLSDLRTLVVAARVINPESKPGYERAA